LHGKSIVVRTVNLRIGKRLYLKPLINFPLRTRYTPSSWGRIPGAHGTMTSRKEGSKECIILRGNTSAIVTAAATATSVCMRACSCRTLVSRRIPAYERRINVECSRIATRFTYLRRNAEAAGISISSTCSRSSSTTRMLDIRWKATTISS